MGRRSRPQLAKELASLYGPVGLTRLLARYGVSRLMGRLPRQEGAERFYSMGQLCKAYGIVYKLIGSPNDPAYIRELSSRRPDLVVSVACPYILKKECLGIAPLGCINIHHAPLPKYKGMMPTFWQMYHGEKRVGVTIHYMSPRVDEGEVLLQDDMAIESGESLDHLIRRAKRHGAHCMAKVLRQIASNTQATIPLNGAKGSYFTFPTIEEAREFRRRGFRAI